MFVKLHLFSFESLLILHVGRPDLINSIRLSKAQRKEKKEEKKSILTRLQQYANVMFIEYNRNIFSNNLSQGTVYKQQ